jgi:hypothetical protein
MVRMSKLLYMFENNVFTIPIECIKFFWHYCQTLLVNVELFMHCWINILLQGTMIVIPNIKLNSIL